MFDESNNINEFDQMMKAILDDGQEEVPAHVWDAVSEGLDNAARRKTAVLWFRRTAISVAAAAAVVMGVIFSMNPEKEHMLRNVEEGLIAVAEAKHNTPENPAGHMDEGISVLAGTAQVQQPVHSAAFTSETIIPQTASEAISISDASPSIEDEVEDRSYEEPQAEKIQPKPAEYFPETWEEEKAEKRKVSLMLSGLASTNSTHSQNRLKLMKAPTITSAPTQTGITETSTSSTYGLPVSFGAGVKIGVSERWSIGTGANYTILTRQFYGKYTKVGDTGNSLQSTYSDIRNTQHYVGIPVNAYYDIVNKDKVNLYAYAGGTVEKCLADNYNVLSTSIRHHEKVSGVQLSANAGIGVEFMIGRHLGLYIDPSVRYYFDCDQPKNIRTVQPLMLGFEMGLRARL